MKEHKLTVDVYASWGDVCPRYRVYVDGELLTERDFIWPGSSQYVRENIIVNLPAGPHTLQVEQVNTGGTILTKNVTLNGAPSSYQFNTNE
jgi:hypothetical protein